MAKYKKKNLLTYGKKVAAKVWNTYWRDDGEKAKRANKIHIGKINKDGRFYPECGVIETDRYTKHEVHLQVESAQRSEFCKKCLSYPKHVKFVEVFKFEKETMVIEPGYPDTTTAVLGGIAPVVLGCENHDGGINWSKKVHAGIPGATRLRPACGQKWGRYHRGRFKVVTSAGFGDLCGNCGKYPEYYIPMLQKLGLTCTTPKDAGKGLKRVVGNEKDHYLVMPRMPKTDGGIKILSFTKAGLLDYLKSKPELVEKINNEIYIFIGQWTTPVIKYKKVVEEITL